MKNKIHSLLQDSSPLVMGILNVTPDSFSDGGLFFKRDVAIKYVKQMIVDGAEIIDIGGESTRPGASEVSVDEELQRVIPIIETVRQNYEVAISIDTSKPEVMREAIMAGANLINDVKALQEENAVETAAELKVPVCLMHMQGKPRTMQKSPEYVDVVKEVISFLQERILLCRNAGIAAENIIVDPGFGFGKTLEHNLTLFKHLDEFTKLGHALLVGVSRKSMIGAVLDNAPADERLFGSVALATLAAWKNANILRVHDVKATTDALKLCQAVKEA